MVCVAGRAVSADLRINFRAARNCMRIIFEDQGGCALSKHKPTAPAVKRQ